MAAIIAVGWRRRGWLERQSADLAVGHAVPARWALSPLRFTAVLASAGYFLEASHGLPHGVSSFYGSGVVEWEIALWVAASLSFVGVHASSGRCGWDGAGRCGMAVLQCS